MQILLLAIVPELLMGLVVLFMVKRYRRCSLLAILAAVLPASAQIPAPQINLTGNIGCQGFPCVNSGTLIMPSDANYALSAQETSAFYIKVTSAVSLTATRNLISPAGRFPFTIENATTGGQSIQIIGASGTGVTIASGNTVSVWNDGTNFVQIGVPGGGGGCTLGTVICNAGSINQILAQVLGTTFQVNNLNKIVYSNGYSTIEQAVAACNSVTPCQIILSSALTQSTAGTYTIPSGIALNGLAGGSITPGSTKTLDFSNSVFSGPPVAFFTGAGTISGLSGAVDAEWFGAVPYSSFAAGAAGTDSTAALQATINSLRGGWMQLQCNFYRTTSALSITRSNVGIKGTCPGFPYNVPVPTPIASVILSTSASADIVDVAGASTGNPVIYNVLSDFSVMRSVIPTGTATGLSLNYAWGAFVNRVQSHDSIRNFYFHSVPSLGGGCICETLAGWNGNISGYTTQTVYGYYLDSADGNAENSINIRYGGSSASFPGGVTSTGYEITGTAINDVNMNNMGSAGMSYAMVINYTGGGAVDSDTDIHIDFPAFDSCLISCVVVSNVTSSGPGAIEFDHGYFQSAVAGGKLFNIGSSSGITISNSQILDFSASGKTGIYASSSKSLVIANNTFQGFGVGTSMSFVGTTNSSVTGNAIVQGGGSGMTNAIILTSTSTNNAITGNTVTGNGNSSAQYSFDGTSLANDFVGNACSQGSGWTSCVSGAVIGTAPSFLGTGSSVNGSAIVTASTTQTVVNCSTSGTATFSEPIAGTSLKEVEIYAAACNGTASYTYPTAFTNTPQVLSQGLAAIATSVTTTAVTITGLPSTGFLKLDGY